METETKQTNPQGKLENTRQRKHYSFVDDCGAIYGAYATSEKGAWQIFAKVFPHKSDEELKNFLGLVAIEEVNEDDN